MDQPQYQSYWQSALEWNSTLMFIPMMFGIVAVSLLIAHMILKRKRKPRRPYLVLIIAGWLFFFGVPSSLQGLLLIFIIIFSPHLQTLEMITGMMYQPVIGFSFTIIAALLISKPRSVRQLYGKYFDQKMQIILYDNHLRINLNILEKMGAVKGSFYILYDNVVSAISEPPHNLTGMKIAGTNFPKLLEIGTYLSGTDKQFWYVKKRKHNFLILVLKSNFYSKIIIELENSEDVAKKINELIGKEMK